MTSPTMPPATTYRPSRYISRTHDEDGAMIVYCSLTGAIGTVPPDDVDRARQALRAGSTTSGPLAGVLADLADGGFLVPEGLDERQVANENYIARYTSPNLHLILMPTEQCNFRCVYCYESFTRGTMTPDVQQGIKRYLASQEGLDQLVVSWFGGEPLLAPDVVLDLTAFMREYSEANRIDFRCSATTNGSLLTPDLANRLIPAGLSQIQVSLDGLAQEHDQRRVGARGEATFATILSNLRYLHDSDLEFEAAIRYNFDPGNLPKTREFYEMLKTEFGGDPRFVTEMQPIGKWGGPNDDSLAVCEGHATYRSLVEAKHIALKAGFRETQTRDVLRPNGAVCYAANPRSFVIGPDGKIYKCTVELDYHDRNIVGQLHADGRMDLDWNKMALWCETNGMDPGKKCGTCYFSPACHGAVCPKECMDEPECACPKAKHTIGDTLKFIRLETVLAGRNG